MAANAACILIVRLDLAEERPTLESVRAFCAGRQIENALLTLDGTLVFAASRPQTGILSKMSTLRRRLGLRHEPTALSGSTYVSPAAYLRHLFGDTGYDASRIVFSLGPDFSAEAICATLASPVPPPMAVAADRSTSGVDYDSVVTTALKSCSDDGMLSPFGFADRVPGGHAAVNELFWAYGVYLRGWSERFRREKLKTQLDELHMMLDTLCGSGNAELKRALRGKICEGERKLRALTRKMK